MNRVKPMSKEGELPDTLKEPIIQGISNELEEINEKLRRLFPKRRALLDRMEVEESLKAFLESEELPKLWAQVKRRKYVALLRAGFTEEEALKLTD